MDLSKPEISTASTKLIKHYLGWDIHEVETGFIVWLITLKALNKHCRIEQSLSMDPSEVLIFLDVVEHETTNSTQSMCRYGY